MIWFFQTLEFWSYFYTDWILTSSFETLDFCFYFCEHWNSYVVLPLKSLEFWPYFCRHWNSHIIHPRVGILALFFTHWNFDLILLNIGILVLLLQTLEFLCNPSSANIEIVALSFHTLKFWSYFLKNYISPLSFQTLEL